MSAPVAIAAASSQASATGTAAAAAPVSASKPSKADRAKKRKADEAAHTARMFAHEHNATTQAAVTRLRQDGLVTVPSSESQSGLSFASAETENARVDLFSSMVRGADRSHMSRLLPVAWSESAEHTVQLILHARDARGGKGERLVSIDALMWLRQHKPSTYLQNLTTFLGVGYFKDLLQIAQRVVEENLPPLGTTVTRVPQASKAKSKERANKKAKVAPAASSLSSVSSSVLSLGASVISSFFSSSGAAPSSASIEAPAAAATAASSSMVEAHEIVELELLAEFLRNDWELYTAHVAKYGAESLVKKGPKSLPLADPKRAAAKAAFDESIARGEPARERPARKVAKLEAMWEKQMSKRRGAGASSSAAPSPPAAPAPVKAKAASRVIGTAKAPDSSEAELVSKQVADLIYSDYAGVSVIRRAGVSYDAHSNPQGSEFDLAMDGVFVGYTVVIGQFYTDSSFEVGMPAPIAALEKKGFTVRRTQDEAECAKWLDDPTTDAAWIISGSGAASSAWVAAMHRFHRRGKGIMMYGDNAPFFTHANAFLRQYQVTLTGNYIGSKHLAYGSSTAKGQFGEHLIFTGVEKLYEGITICHVQTANARVVPIATATDGKTCVSVYDPIPSKFNRLSTAELAEGQDRGRILIDCGFTKLYCSWSDAGTARYVVNATCWTMGAERGLKDRALVEQVRANATGKSIEEFRVTGPTAGPAPTPAPDATMEPGQEEKKSNSLVGSLVASIGSVFGGGGSSRTSAPEKAKAEEPVAEAKMDESVDEEKEDDDDEAEDDAAAMSDIGVFSRGLQSLVTPTSLNPSGAHSRHLQLSLAAKWAPSEGSSFDKSHAFAKRLATLLFPHQPQRMRVYREMLGACRAYLGVTERLLCTQQFDAIQFEAVPSKCHLLLKSAFQKHCSERYTEYKEKLKKGTAKINTTGLQPHEILTPYIVGRAPEVDVILEAQWTTLVAKLKEKYMQPDGVTGEAHPGLGSAVAVVDVSGSMTQNNSIPLKVAISLGLLISSISAPPFRGRVITFSATPTWHVVPQLGERSGGGGGGRVTVKDQVESLNRADWGCNTNFEGVFDLILEMAVAAKCSQADLPRSVFCVSDMRFDEACFHGRGRAGIASTFVSIRTKYAARGYAAPNLIFWNCAAQPDGATAIDDSQEGLAIVGGFSAELLKSFLEGKRVTPMDIMLGAIQDYQAAIDESER